MVNGAPPKTIIKNFSKTELYRKEMLEVVQSIVKNEIMLISKQDSDLFKGHASNNDRLIHFDWESTGQKLKCRAPYLYSFYNSAVCFNPKKNLPCMLTSLSVLFYGRSQKMSQLQ